MLEELQRLYMTTSRLAENINEATTTDLERLVFQRQVVVNKINNSNGLTEQEKEIAAQLKQFDEIIVGRMEQLKNEAAQGLKKIRISQLQKNSYNAAYTVGSSFFDSKK
ncbi:hypothetical protein [Paenibacillus pinistramenti]|uniref:hypothetical protein n=1 Tax=Paenibacillus pinistramenti TaxID=1768003 RepID=UPI001109AEE1|nr:hypothetical protein [Paenibacillus pinistramenti]